MEDDEFESDDSFFDDPKISKKSTTSTQSHKAPAEKKSLEELFGFQEEKKPTVVEPHRPGSSAKSSLSNKVRFDLHEPPVPVSAEISSKSKSLDWLGGSDETDTGFASKATSKIDIDDILSTTNNKTESRKSLDFLDDILPGQKSKKIAETERATSFQDIFKDSTASKSSNEKLNTIFEPPQGPRRGRRGSNTGITDVLGLFGTSSESEGNTKANTEITNVNNVRTASKEAAKTSLEAQRAESPMKIASNEEKSQETVKKNYEDSNFQSNISNLQAQESFLLVSLQMKKYEENLAEIKNSQQDILKKQEDQFGIFLNKYLEKQKGIEQEILGQQERINEHIRIMALNGFHQAPKSKNRISDEDEEIEETEELNTIVHSLKQRHQEEFFLMEESYKKQISLLEKSSENLELRLNQEIENTNKTYEEKVLKLKDQNKDEINYWIGKVEKLNKTHIEDLENLKENHNRMLKETKDEFLIQLERIKDQRNLENDLFISSDALSQKLNSNIEKLETNEIFLGKLQEKVVNDYGILSVARENSLQTKEKEVSQMRAALEKCRENAENDRSQLLSLIRTLELKISEQNQNSQEERWALQQAAATLAARAASFDRETEFNRASIERERQQLKSLKETLLAEQEKAALELTEQKIQFAAEKSRLEVSAKLNNNYEVEKIKAEAETAIQVAKELTEKLNIERNFIQKQKVELEDARKKLSEKERVVLEKEETLEEMKRMMEHRGNEDKRVFQETKYLENRYKEKLFELQVQAASLNSREKKLAEEKLSLSKERLSLYSSKSQANNNHKKCMLCQAEEEKVVIKHPMDLDSVRLRMEIFDDERNSEVSNNA